MERVLIVAQKFPPNIETAANRAYSWALYLNECGYKPIIITRNWDRPLTQDSIVNTYTPSESKEVIHKEFGTYEVYYLPFSGNLRTNFYLKNKGNNGLFARLGYKSLSLLEQWTDYSDSFRFSEHSFIIDWTLNFIKENRDIKKMIITVSPFNYLIIGKLAKQKYGVSWIADYRDPWNTDENGLMVNEGSNSFLHKLLRKKAEKAERAWSGSASVLTSVSDYLTHKIADFAGVKERHTIYNGFFEAEIKPSNDADLSRNEYNIIYNGSLYHFQKVEVFLNALKKVIDRFAPEIKINVSFVGLGFSKEHSERVISTMNGYEQHYKIYPRLPKEEYLKIQARANLLLIINPEERKKGIATSKIFDYISVEKPVLAMPNDHDVVEKLLTESGQGIFADSEEEAVAALSKLIEEFIQTGRNQFDYKRENVTSYSRKNQAMRLGALLDQLK